MLITDVIEHKKAGRPLSRDEIAFFANGAADGSIPDYQLSALLMAITLKGMDAQETAALTMAMAQTGEMLDLSPLGARTVDKHSTGGVGDKTTLVVAPLAAACGLTMAKMSGRGLGETGGTIDKLESIPGLRTNLTEAEFLSIAKRVGAVVSAQTRRLCPADGVLYALRDVTATVDSLPLIASSVMCKKLAAGARHILLDVKFGSGAFMKTAADAQALAQQMVQIGVAAGRKTAALLTDMDRPLGRTVGNALEVAEAVELLQGGGPDDLREVCLALTSNLLELAGEPDAQQKAARALQSGAGYAKLAEMVQAQGGDPHALEGGLPQAEVSRTLAAGSDGWVCRVDAGACAHAALLLGAGRKTKADSIDPAAGLRLHKQPGDPVQKGEPLVTLFAASEALLPAAEAAVLPGIVVGQQPPALPPHIWGKI